MVTINCLPVPLNVVVGLRCHKKQQKIKWYLEEFSVLEIVSNMVVKKKEITMPYGFEGLLRYYMKLTSIQFIEQWVILKFYYKYFHHI